MHSHSATNQGHSNQKTSTCEGMVSVFAAHRTDLPRGWISPPLIDTACKGMTEPLSRTNQEATSLWTTHELAKFLKCSERQIARLRDEGMPTLMIGALVRFSKFQVMEWLEGRLNKKPIP